MVVPETTKRVTLDEYERLIAKPENEERLLERIYGEIVEKPSTQLHGMLASQFNALLFMYLREHPIGWAFSEVQFKLPGDDENDRIPDVAFVLKEGRSIDPDAPLNYMPELLVEIQSPGQSDRLMADKAAYYLSRGAKMVWLVYPHKRLIEVLTPTDRKLLTLEDTLEGGDLLPGFSVAVREIFDAANEAK
jgi:Uma2 family endonuclease